MTHPWANAIDAICWMVVLPTLAFLAYRSYGRSDDRPALVRRWIISAALVLLMRFIFWFRLSGHPVFMTVKPFLILFPALILGRMWVPSIGAILTSPFTSAFDGGDDEVEAKPFYFIAEGKRQKGLYEEAMAEV